MAYAEYCVAIRLGIMVCAVAASGISRAEPARQERWLADQDGCKAWPTASVLPDAHTVWNGKCVDGRIDGPGKLSWFKNGEFVASLEGTAFAKGRLSGRGFVTDANGFQYSRLYHDGREVEPQIRIWSTGNPYVSGTQAIKNGRPILRSTLQGKCAALDYPAAVPQTARTGTTVIQFSVDGKGTVRDARVLESAAHPLLDQAALRYVVSCAFPSGDGKANGSVTLQQGITWDGSKQSVTPPQFAQMAKPVYPGILRRSGNNGLVLADVLVAADGTVADIKIEESSHPAFEREAVRALLQFRFKPAELSGRPIPMRAVAPLKFSIGTDSSADEYPAPFKFPEKSPASMPAEFQYDTPPRIKVTAPVVYPFEQLKAGATGSARVSVIVDPAGNIRSVDVMKASEPEFGAATKAALSSWVFEPARKDGKPTWSAFSFEQAFAQDERNLNLDERALGLLELSRKEAGIYELNELDSMPKKLYSPAPPYPLSLKEQKISGKVLVKFYIDKTGAVQLPQIVEAENGDLAWLAMTAVLRWQFSPPMREGKPVEAVATLPVTFAPASP